MTTGQAAWCAIWLLIEPSVSRWKPPPPRAPMTSRSLSFEASISASAGKPAMERTCTDAGLAGPASFSAFSVASSTARRSFSWSPLSAGTATGLPVTQLAMTGWTVRTVSPQCRVAASCTAQSRARCELCDPSIPTVIPDISCSFGQDAGPLPADANDHRWPAAAPGPSGPVWQGPKTRIALAPSGGRRARP